MQQQLLLTRRWSLKCLFLVYNMNQKLSQEKVFFFLINFSYRNKTFYNNYSKHTKLVFWKHPPGPRLVSQGAAASLLGSKVERQGPPEQVAPD